jgi:site-specific DNA-methyltransferase (cytosine-N4-specific)
MYSQQLALFPEIALIHQEAGVRDGFSHGGVCPNDARMALEQRYGLFLQETDFFNRQLVSFQANKTDILHSWIKYREGFSAELVQKLLDEFGVKPRDTVLDPFAGSCTTLLVAKMSGIDAVGIELLPHCHLAWEAKSRAFDYDLNELKHVQQTIAHTDPPPTNKTFPHIQITMSAFPPQVEADLMAYTVWVEKLDICENTKVLLRLILTSILEDVSYTRKDGQYLRWDERADKLQSRNQQRIAQGKQPVKGIHKGDLPTVKTMLQKALAKILLDVGRLQHQTLPLSRQELIAGNTLTVLPALEANRFSAVITSPPYANRYDYTRTYALELAYLGVDEEIFRLRQRLLSCTVENRPKLDWLQEYYTEIGQSERYLQISRMASSNATLQEINAALQIRNMRGEINNAGVLTMIDQYFTELAFIFAELYRVCRSGAYVAFVNDNVRYAGEVIPVDLLSTDLAASLGFEPVKIYVLPQRKGNSSQQMGKFGRVALRKSITVWRKP